MGNKYFNWICVFVLLCSCAVTDTGTDVQTSLKGKYVHVIQNCDNSLSTELNCEEFLEFHQENSASLLFAGADIVNLMWYQIQGDSLKLTNQQGGNLELSFYVKNDSTLVRKGTDDLWKRK